MILFPFKRINIKPCQKCCQPRRPTSSSSSSSSSSLSTTITITTTLKLQTTHMGLKIDAHKNIDRQNNSVTKELMDNTLIIGVVWDPAQQRLEKR